MYNEKFTRLYLGEDIHLKPGESYTLKFNGSGLDLADRLFFTGETALFYQWKDEPDYPQLYRKIDDALNTKEALKSQYALDFSADYYDYPKVAYHKLMWPPVLSYLGLVDYTDNWTMGISAKAKDLHVARGGYLRFIFEVRYKRDGLDVHSTMEAPDEVFTIDVPEGSYGWQRLEQSISFDAKKVGSVSCILEGENYGGKVFLEAPTFLSENGYNILTEFAPHAGEKTQFNWLGQNLSRKEWPEFEITLNGELIHCGELFERCHRYAENEIAIEKGSVLPGENELTIKLISDYRDALAYNLHEIGMVSHDDSFVVAVPEIARAGEPFAVVIRTAVDHAAVKFTPITGNVQPVSNLTVETAGLNALQFVCQEPCAPLSLKLEYGGQEEVCTVSRCVLHEEDGVVTGTSDLIYINQNERSFEDFLSWYLTNNVGNLLTIRQSYRWNGTRALNDSLWWKTSKFLNDAGLVYAHMMDCRELPGCDANPTYVSLEGKGFLGRQTHERDGAVSYWGIREVTGDFNDEMWYDMVQRMAMKHPHTVGEDCYPENHIYKNGRHTLFRDMTVPEDMEAVAKDTVYQLRRSRHDSTRHTGPSTLFKYFYQAGYKWTGAELMYGPHELVASAIRGASDLYGGKTGSHLAVQWSSSPHDTEQRYRRYRLAMYVCYMQGIDEINTEEGLWHLEEYYNYFHRFSDACVNHTIQQQDFYRYVASHSRSGKFHTPIGFVSGRYDGWRCFGRGTWGRPSFGFSDAEKGWDILKYFYPLSVLNALYIHGCKNEPQGFYTGTPQGNVDIVPIENEEFSRYRLLVAPGYNKALPEDMDKFDAYVRRGGKLIIGWPQLAVTTDRKAVVNYDHWYIDHPFRNAVAAECCFVEDTYNGKALRVSCHKCDAPVLLRTDSGRPLVYEISLGEGSVLFVNTKEYVGNDAVYEVYTKVLDLAVPQCLAGEEAYGKGKENVQFSVFDQGNGQKHIYFLATDWYSDSAAARKGELVLDGTAYPVEVPFGQLVKAVSCGGKAVWPAEDICEVVSFDGKTAKVQGVGKAEFRVAKNGKVETVMVDFSENTVQQVDI